MSKNSIYGSSRESSNSGQGPGSRAGSKSGSIKKQPVVASSSPLDALSLARMFIGGNNEGSEQSSRQSSRSAKPQQSNSNPLREFFTNNLLKPVEKIVEGTQKTVKDLTSHYEGLTSNNTPPPDRSEPRPRRRPGPGQSATPPTTETSTNYQNQSPLKQSPEIYASDIEAIRQAVNSSNKQNTSDLKSYLNELERSVNGKSGVADFRKSSPSKGLSNPAEAISLTDDAKQKLNLIISGIESWRDWEGKKAVVQAINRGRENFSGRSGRSGRSGISSISSISELGQKVVISTSQPPANRYANPYSAALTANGNGNNPSNSQSQSPKFYKSDLNAVKKFLNFEMQRNNLGLDKLRKKLELIEERTENLQPGEAINIANSKKGVFNMMIDELGSMNDLHRMDLVDLINEGRKTNRITGRLKRISALRQPDGKMPTTPSANPTNARAANMGSNVRSNKAR